jgi:hypothetical protein
MAQQPMASQAHDGFDLQQMSACDRLALAMDAHHKTWLPDEKSDKGLSACAQNDSTSGIFFIFPRAVCCVCNGITSDAMPFRT